MDIGAVHMIMSLLCKQVPVLLHVCTCTMNMLVQSLHGEFQLLVSIV